MLDNASDYRYIDVTGVDIRGRIVPTEDIDKKPLALRLEDITYLCEMAEERGVEGRMLERSRVNEYLDLYKTCLKRPDELVDYIRRCYESGEYARLDWTPESDDDDDAEDGVPINQTYSEFWDMRYKSCLHESDLDWPDGIGYRLLPRNLLADLPRALFYLYNRVRGKWLGGSWSTISHAAVFSVDALNIQKRDVYSHNKNSRATSYHYDYLTNKCVATVTAPAGGEKVIAEGTWKVEQSSTSWSFPDDDNDYDPWRNPNAGGDEEPDYTAEGTYKDSEFTCNQSLVHSIAFTKNLHIGETVDGTLRSVHYALTRRTVHRKSPLYATVSSIDHPDLEEVWAFVEFRVDTQNQYDDGIYVWHFLGRLSIQGGSSNGNLEIEIPTLSDDEYDSIIKTAYPSADFSEDDSEDDSEYESWGYSVVVNGVCFLNSSDMLTKLPSAWTWTPQGETSQDENP